MIGKRGVGNVLAYNDRWGIVLIYSFQIIAFAGSTSIKSKIKNYKSDDIGNLHSSAKLFIWVGN